MQGPLGLDRRRLSGPVAVACKRAAWCALNTDSHHCPLANSYALALAARFVLFLFCLSLFLAHSYKELEKYGTRLTSTAIRTDTDGAGIAYPNVVVCLKMPFRRKGYVTSRQQYERMSFDRSEVFSWIQEQPMSLNSTAATATVTPVETMWHGRCFHVAIDRGVSYNKYVAMGLKVSPKKANIYLLQENQQLCLVVGYCNVQVHALTSITGRAVTAQIKARKKIWPKRLCHDGPGYNQFNCLKAAYSKLLVGNMSCHLPHQLYYIDNPRLWRPCDPKDWSNFRRAELEANHIGRYLMDRPEIFDCPLHCVHWSFDHQTINFNRDLLESVLAFTVNNSEMSRNVVWLKYMSSKVEVMEEYDVYDLNGIVGSVGGSLGLFLGFSVFDCLSALTRKRNYYCGGSCYAT